VNRFELTIQSDNTKNNTMKKREPVSRIMTRDVFAINVKTGLKEAEHEMKERNIRHVPVVSGDELIGMLSLTDLMRISFGDVYGDSQSDVDYAIYDMLSLKQVMVTHPVSINPNTTIKEAAEILANKEFHALPVTEDGKLLGIVTSTDLIKYLIDLY
jgi:CBS domain-containing membrane protein